MSAEATPSLPSRGEVWRVDADGPTRDALVVSADGLNHGPAELVVVLPVTTVHRGIASHVPIESNGAAGRSYVVCEQPFTIARGRLRRRSGRIGASALREVERYLRVLLEL